MNTLKRSTYYSFAIFALLVLGVFSATPHSASAQEFHQDFESAPVGYFVSPVTGKASTGSTVSTSTERAHSGTKATRVAYSFSGSGNMNLNITTPPTVVPQQAELLYVSFWCYGAGANDFGAPGLRLIDATGECFQYAFANSNATLLNTTGWREVSGAFQLSQPQTSWGGQADGVPNYPLRFLGLGLGHSSTQAASGTLYFDDFAMSVRPLVVASASAPLELDAFGLNDPTAKYSDYEAAIDEMIASGVKWVRAGREWGSIQPRVPASGDDGYDPAVLALLDAIINRLNAGGVKVVFLLGYSPKWASSNSASNEFSRYKPADLNDWANYVRFMATRYNGKVRHWEIWNEEDHIGFWKDTPQDYVNLLQAAATEIRAVNPNNKILMGGLALSSGSGLGSFFDTILSQGAANHFDIINYHSYGDSTQILAHYNDMQAVIYKYGLRNRKVWVTEAGYTTEGITNREVIKAEYVDQTYLSHIGTNGIERMFWYIHRNVTGVSPHEDNFGLVANDRTPLKALYHYQAVNGAESNFLLEKNYPNQTPYRRTLDFVLGPAGHDGGYVVDYAADGSTKRVPSTRYMYFRVNDNWLYDGNAGLDSKVYVDVTYLNSGTGQWSLEYDATANAYTALSRTKSNTGTWLTETFTLDNVKMANRQNLTSDFRLRATNADLIVSKVVVRNQTNVGRISLGSPDTYRYLLRPDSTDPAQELYNPVATMGGLSCRQITSNPKYIYIRVSDGLLHAGDNQVQISLTFWDSGTDKLSVEYNSTSSAYKSAPLITKTNTNTWKRVTLTLTDANFVNAQNYTSDFRISNAYDGSVEYIRDVEVQKLP